MSTDGQRHPPDDLLPAGSPAISFGIIVLNGEPFTRYCLRALYPFAHEIIVVEGANPSAAAQATPDGHSRDGTLETLYRFKAEEDPANKVQIVVRDGFWSEKDEQSQAYAARATGDYLWQVDIDEFYHPHDMQRILAMLRDDPTITAMSFRQIKFWGGFDYTVDSWYARRGAEIFHRLFKWGPGYRYVSHRPPTVQNDQGQDLRQIKWLNGYSLAQQGILLYHYSLLLPQQVLEKSDYYGKAAWAQRPRSQEWAEEVFMRLRRPYRVHNVYDSPSWLERFAGEHPPAISQLRADIVAGRVVVELRQTDDIERLLRSPFYRLGAALLRRCEPLDRQFSPRTRRWVYRLLRFCRDPRGSTRAVQQKLRKLLMQRP